MNIYMNIISTLLETGGGEEDTEEIIVHIG